MPAAESFLGNIYVSVAYSAEGSGSRNRAFVDAFRQAQNGQTPNPAAACAYDAIHLIARVIVEAGGKRDNISDRLANVGLRTAPFDGATGTIAFDVNGDLRRRDVAVVPGQPGN